MPQLFLQKFPYDDKIIVLRGEHAGKVETEFIKWVEGVEQQVGSSPVLPTPAEVIPNAAQPGTQTNTGTIGGNLAAGLYRVTWASNVLTAEAASTVTLALAWTHGGVARSQSFTALNGAGAANQQGATYPVWVDAGTPISYTLTYVGATLVYDSALSAEFLQSIE